MFIFTQTPPPRIGCDTRSILMGGKAGLNSKVVFFLDWLPSQAYRTQYTLLFIYSKGKTIWDHTIPARNGMNLFFLSFFLSFFLMIYLQQGKDDMGSYHSLQEWYERFAGSETVVYSLFFSHTYLSGWNLVFSLGLLLVILGLSWS